MRENAAVLRKLHEVVGSTQGAPGAAVVLLPGQEMRA